MLTWRMLCLGLIYVSLLFFMIPVKISRPIDDTQSNITRLNLKDPRVLFDVYIKEFNKTYEKDSPEYNFRFNNFKETLARVREMNTNRSNTVDAQYGFTNFSDLSPEEFKNLHLDKMKRAKKRQTKKKYKFNNLDMNTQRLRLQMNNFGLPLRVDWRKSGIISDVMTQGLCGSCWAISTIQTIEALHRKLHNKTSLSVQQIIDCARNGNYGCLGGDICNLLQWLVANDVSIVTENEYPITGRTNQCHWKKTLNSTGAKVKSYTCESLVNNENKLLKWLATEGPVAVAVNALSWQNYLGGVIQYHCNDSYLDLNHAVQIVGYDLTAEVPYYICKNSWGYKFGNYGYVYLAIGKNICGLANEVSLITVL